MVLILWLCYSVDSQLLAHDHLGCIQRGSIQKARQKSVKKMMVK